MRGMPHTLPGVSSRPSDTVDMVANLLSLETLNHGMAGAEYLVTGSGYDDRSLHRLLLAGLNSGPLRSNARRVDRQLS